MRYRLNNVEIIDPTSDWNKQVKDILVINGILQDVGQADGTEEVIDGTGLRMIPALCETYASIGDPGHEYREDIQSISKAALKGGVTHVCAIADNDPVTQHKTHVEYIIKNTQGKLVEIWPLGAITEGLKGKNPTEMLDMHYAGAVAFTDAPHAIDNTGVMLRALQYIEPIDGVVYSIPYDEHLTGEGQVNEGVISVNMGMKGIPHLAETLQIHRDLELLAYGGGKLHFSGISTAEGVEQIRQAKARGLNVTASVYVHHLLLTEEVVSDFDTNYKVIPPLRTALDREALLQGLEDGTIDMVSIQHIPLDVESKRLEFEYATPGMANIEFAFPLAYKALGCVQKVVQKFAIAPRKLFKKELNSIKIGNKANFLLVDTNSEKIVKESQRQSLSANSPFYGVSIKGVVKAVFHNNQLHWND